jgi:hypothetical protein
VSAELPDLGVVFWPVGTGDSSTVVVTDEVLIQVDLNDRAKADDDDTPEVPVADLLLEALPTGSDGRPLLAAFMLTHADEDHCSGFADLLGKATIGELWATPRMWREYLNDGKDAGLCEDARVFHQEVKRRVEAVKKAVAAGKEIVLGDRVLVVGYDTDEHKHAYHDLPGEYLLKPGMSVTKINGVDHAGRFEAFIHAPFKADCAAARNETSLSLQVTLTEDGGQDGKVLLFGDLAYETIMKIFSYRAAVRAAAAQVIVPFGAHAKRAFFDVFGIEPGSQMTGLRDIEGFRASSCSYRIRTPAHARQTAFPSPAHSSPTSAVTCARLPERHPFTGSAALAYCTL